MPIFAFGRFFITAERFLLENLSLAQLNAEMGLQAVDRDLTAASSGERIATPSGMVLDGSLDAVEAPPARSEFDDTDSDWKADEIPSGLNHLEFYLLKISSANISFSPSPNR